METRELIIESETHGTHTVLYDACDADKVEPYTWHIAKGSKTYYVKRNLPRVGGKRRSPVTMHGELINPPSGMVVDHINQNGLDNRRENLRAGTRSQNMMNRTKTAQNSTGFKGVYDCGDSKKNPYTAKIQRDNKVYHLGHYLTAEEAAKVYDKKAIELFGEFAVLNFPKEEYQ